MQLCRARSFGTLGVPCLARYAGDAHSSRRFGAMRPRDHARVRRRAEADADIERVLRQRRRIRPTAAAAPPPADASRANLEISGADVAAPEAERRVDSQQPLGGALGTPQQFLHVVDLAEDAARVFEVQFAVGREAHAPRRAVYQRHAQPRLHRRQVLLTAGCDAQLPRRGAQAAGSRPARRRTPGRGWMPGWFGMRRQGGGRPSFCPPVRALLKCRRSRRGGKKELQC